MPKYQRVELLQLELCQTNAAFAHTVKQGILRRRSFLKLATSEGALKAGEYGFSGRSE